MKRWLPSALLAAMLVFGVAQPGLAGAKADPWRPIFVSPANPAPIQTDEGTVAGVAGWAYPDAIRTTAPSASGIANHASFAR